jgi:hypothetical protein
MPLAMARSRPRCSLSGAPPAAGPKARVRGVAVAVALALALAPEPARAGPAAADPGVLTAEGQAHRDAGDLDGAIDRWQRALAVLPVTQATAHRRAGLVLAIAAAHAGLYDRGGDVKELRAALEVLDGYLAGLDPTDDENRVAVEARRAALADRLAQDRGRPDGDAPVAIDSGSPTAPDRRLWLAGGTVVGLGVLGAVTLGLGLGLGARADRALQAAVALPGDDPQRDAAKAAALARGQQANDAALAGGVIGGVLLATGVALLIAGAIRQARARRWPQGGRVTLHATGLAIRF